MRFNIGERAVVSVFLAVFFIAGVLTGCSTTDSGMDQASGDVQSRGRLQMQRPVKPEILAQPTMPAQTNIQMPSWPQRFEVQGPEVDSFGFAVTQPGPITVDVQAQGALLIVTLQSPGSQPITQQTTGNLRMNYDVMPQDVQKSLFWTVQIRLAQPMPPQTGGRASGTINVQYPPVNQAAVQQAVQALAAQQKQPSAQEQQQAAAQAATQMEQAFQQRKAQFEQQEMRRRDALIAPLQPVLARLQAQAGAAIRPRGVEETSSSEPAAVPGEDVTSRGMTSTSGILLLTPMFMASPTISLLSVTQGQPGDPILIEGSGFGSNAGEVHFVIAPGIDRVAPANGLIWNNTQIFATVPDVSGFGAFNGTVYIKRAMDKVNSNLMLFRFNPLTELRLIRCPNDDFILEKLVYTSLYSCAVWRMNQNWFWTPQGNDQFFVNTRLKNGWTVVQPPTVIYPNAQYTAGGAYILESRVGTDSPYMNVRYWVNAGFSNNLGYATSLLILGPKGVPDGVVCTQIPCP